MIKQLARWLGLDDLRREVLEQRVALGRMLAQAQGQAEDVATLQRRVQVLEEREVVDVLAGHMHAFKRDTVYVLRVPESTPRDKVDALRTALAREGVYAVVVAAEGLAVMTF